MVGSRPDGWWKDRAGAARRLHERLLVADTSYDEVVLVLEGAAKGGVPAGRDGHVLTVHAQRDGDDDDRRRRPGPAAERGDRVAVVTADRMLAGAASQGVGRAGDGPVWLLDQLRADTGPRLASAA